MNEVKNSYQGQQIILKDGAEVAPGIFIYDNVIDNPQEIIDFALSTPDRWRDSQVSGSDNKGVVDKKVRNTRVLDVPAVYANDIKWFEIAQLIWKYADRYGAKNSAPYSNMEYLQLLHYSTQDGFYRPHTDSGPGSQRIFSALLYLNDVEEGGETYFNRFDIAVKPRAGRLVLFPANFIYEHEARTPKSNDKFALVTWFNPIM